MRLDLFERLLNFCDPDRDLSLLLLEFLQRDDLIAHLGKIRGFRRAFPPQRDLGFLQAALLVPERDARTLAAHLQRQLTKSGGDKTHEGNLRRITLRCWLTLPGR